MCVRAFVCTYVYNIGMDTIKCEFILPTMWEREDHSNSWNNSKQEVKRNQRKTPNKLDNL